MYMMYYSFDSLLSEKLVVSVISTFSDMHAVVVYLFPYYCFAGWLNCCLLLDICADVVALMMMRSSALHRAWGITAGNRALGSHTCVLGLNSWFTPRAAQVSMP